MLPAQSPLSHGSGSRNTLGIRSSIWGAAAGSDGRPRANGVLHGGSAAEDDGLSGRQHSGPAKQELLDRCTGNLHQKRRAFTIMIQNTDALGEAKGHGCAFINGGSCGRAKRELDDWDNRAACLLLYHGPFCLLPCAAP